MATEQSKILQGLETAIRMENDGKQFYLKASHSSHNEMGKKLLKSLADEEDNHRQTFEKIYEAVRNKKNWPRVDFHPDGGKKLNTIFAQAIGEIATPSKSYTTELDDVKTALDMESKTYDFYKAQSKAAGGDTERDFYESLAAQERTHHQVLLDYYEYLEDPAAWFVNKEHPILDGG
ncbi:ferritin family protein [Chloroflexota bacterium]